MINHLTDPTLLIVALIASPLFSRSQTVDKFEYKLSSLASDFRNSIDDKDECENITHDCESLADEIEDASTNSELSNQEKKNLHDLQKKAEALESFMGAVNGNTGYMLKETELFLANSIMQANIIAMSNYNFCIDVIEIEIDDYACYFFQNN